MKTKLFTELLQSVKQAKAIERGEMKPGRVFKVAGRSVNVLTARTLKASKAGGSVKRFGNKKELFADVGL